MKAVPAQTRLVTLSAGYLFSLPLASVYRLCYLILHSCEAVRCQREDQHLLRSGGVCAVHSQMFSAFHHLQQSPLYLPEALEVRQPEVVCKGIANFCSTLLICKRGIDTGRKIMMTLSSICSLKVTGNFSLKEWLTGSVLPDLSIPRLET